MAKLSPIGNNAQFINGIPANGAKLFTYVSGSSTKLATFTDEAGATPQTNPIILNARGEPDDAIWLSEGLSYTFVFTGPTDTDPPTSPIWTIDDVTGINDSSVALDQWVDSGVAPTYVNATQFTLPGDQTNAFQVNRRIKATVTAGTVYGYISVSSFAAVTTVTVVLDSGNLDSGLSAIQLGLITPINTSLRVVTGMIADDAVTTGKIADEAVTLAKLAPDAKSDKIQPITASVASNALTITLNPTTLDFRDATLGSGTVNTRNVPSAISMVVSSGSTLGTINAVQNRLAVLAIDNSGTVELAVVNLAGGVNLDETGVISTTAEGGAGGADSAMVVYSTTARTNVPYRVVGFVESTQATAGTWATAPSKIQGAGGLSDVPIAMNAAGDAPMFACRAWVNFDGTGTVAIRASGNVSSITDNNTGDYTVNFTTSMLDTNFSVVASSWIDTSETRFCGARVVNNSSARIKTGSISGGAYTSTDHQFISFTAHC